MTFDPKVHKDGPDTLVVESGGTLLIKDGAQATTTSGVGAVIAVEGLTVEEFGDGVTHKTVFTFDGVSLSTLDNGTAGHGGGVQIYDFPKGLIAIDGASQNWSLLTVDGTGLPDNAEIDVGVGTTVATSAMGSLTTTTQDIITKDDITFSTAVTATHQFQGTVSGAHAIDGSATAKDAYLNVSATAATGAADGTIVLTGTVTILWRNVGQQSS
jgi:hypothetical protein